MDRPSVGVTALVIPDPSTAGRRSSTVVARIVHRWTRGSGAGDAAGLVDEPVGREEPDQSA